MTVEEVSDFVLVETPCRLHKPALQILERDGRLTAVDPPAKRRAGSYPDPNLRVRFDKRLL
jgi:hypothetical protein